MKLLALVPAFAGLVALAVASPIGKADVASKYKNDGTHTYKCDSGTIVLSCVRSGTCSFVEKCLGSAKCVKDDQGAGCSIAAITVKEASVVEVEARDPVDQKKKKPAQPGTYECSNDRTGVLICRFGFCSTDHYCSSKKGESCHDDCACCKKNGLASRQEADRNEEGYQSCWDNDSTPVTCDCTDFTWRSAGRCPGGDHCCARRTDIPNSVYCKC